MKLDIDIARLKTREAESSMNYGTLTNLISELWKYYIANAITEMVYKFLASHHLLHESN